MIQKFINSFKKRGWKETVRLSAAYSKIFSKQKIKKVIKAARLKIIFLQSPTKMIVREIQGSKMLLDLNDIGISRELALRGYHEKNSTDFIKGEIKEGMNIIEVGANIGYYSLLEARLIGPTGHIYAMEPNPKNLQNFKINVILNNLENRVTIYPYAAGNKKETANFYLSNAGNLSSMIKRDDGLFDYQTTEVPMIKLDEEFANVKIDYFRMDVEGYEVEIIKGMHNILSSPSAPYGMFIEVHCELIQKLGVSAEEFMKTLSAYGYHIKKGFYRGSTKKVVNSTEDFLNHPLREKGYWEIFFAKK